ncbi:MAG: hypothetical protein ACLGIT_09905 [Gammaproteobacteria bacterium]|uniref:hypothetical protein n=1 Tax=Azohydromonas sp. TaxID=1872666 RepID=UPI002CE6F6C2|nr:hypothetical protein [Azohydromonas sp.]HMM84807.1 hypothetical protein [Azohydromonas sp.]
MPTPRRQPVVLAALALGLAATAAVALLALRPAPAEAQSVMAIPPCQCSAPTPIAGLSTQVVHCLCGGLACAISQPAGAGAHQMQCVK